MLRKILMAASLVAMFFANSALAGTWTATGTATSHAAEMFGDGTVIIDPGTAAYTLSTGPANGNSFNVDFTLAGATWGAALTSSSLSLVRAAATVPIGSGTANITLVEGGGIADSTAKFRVDATATFTTGAARRQLALDYNIDSASGLNTPGGVVTLAVTLADTLGSIDTAGAAQTVATSAEGSTYVTAGSTTATAAPLTLKRIDVATGSTTFVDTTAAGTLTTPLGTFTIANTAGVYEDDAVNGNRNRVGTASTAWTIGTGDSNSSTGTATLTITGDFSASVGVDADSSALTNDGVQLSGCLTANATTLSATEATFTLTDANVNTAAGAGACTVTMNVDGTTVLSPNTYATAFAFDYNNVDYRDEAGTGNLATLVKNGASVNTDLILTPGGAFDGFVRVSNRSGVAGKVIVTMYNDAGDSVTFDLENGTLAAQASTALVSAADLYAQAQTADATFAHNDGKLRAVFEGEFSDITAQSITISTDSTTFTTF